MDKVKRKSKPFIGYTKDVGYVLSQFNYLDKQLSKLVESHFRPAKNTQDFSRVLLNSSIIGYGAKVKAIANFHYIDKPLVEQLRELGRIRNAFAHENAHPKYIVRFNETKRPIESDYTNSIYIMNSSGKIVEHDFDGMLDKYHQTHQQVIKVINDLLHANDEET